MHLLNSYLFTTELGLSFHFSSLISQMALFNLCPCSSSCHPKHPPLSQTPSSSLPKTSFSYSLSPAIYSSFQNSSFSALAIQSHKTKLVKPTLSNIKSTRPTVDNNKQICCAINDSSSNYGGNKPPRETILLPGCDYEHWLIVMEFPDPKPSSEEMIDTYIKTLAQVVGSEEEAKKRIYALSTSTYTGFQALISEELSEKCKGLPGVLWVLPDSYIDVPNKDYGGDKFVDGKVVPRPQPKAAERQTASRSYGKPRPYEPRRKETRRYERRRDGPLVSQKNPNPEPQQTDMVQAEGQ